MGCERRRWLVKWSSVGSCLAGDEEAGEWCLWANQQPEPNHRQAREPCLAGECDLPEPGEWPLSPG